MENRKEGTNGGGWMSVPAFGDWEKAGVGLPDYSVDFSKIREHRKIHKSDPSRASLGNEEDFLNVTSAANTKAADRRRYNSDDLYQGSISSAAADGDGLRHHRNRSDNDSDFHRRHSHFPTTRKKIMSYFQCCVRV